MSATSSAPLGGRRPRKHAVNGHPGACEGFSKTACHRQLGGLGHTVVNHFGENPDGRFARNKDDPSPIARSHAGQVVTSQAMNLANITFLNV